MYERRSNHIKQERREKAVILSNIGNMLGGKNEGKDKYEPDDFFKDDEEDKTNNEQSNQDKLFTKLYNMNLALDGTVQ